MSPAPESLPTPAPAPEAVTPVASAPDANEWMKREKSAQLLRWEKDIIRPREDAKMKEIDRLLEQHLGEKEYVDSYENQKAKALDAMKSYIKRAYAICMAEAHKSDVDSAGRAQWNARFFNECNKDVNQYIFMITAFLIEATKKSEGPEKGKVDLETLFDLAERGRDIYWQISKEPKYGILLHKINTVPHLPLDAADNEFIIAKFPKRAAGEKSVNDNMKFLEASGAITILYAMNPEQRMEFAKYIIDNKKDEAVGLITSFGSSGFLKPNQLEKIYPLMKLKKEQQESMESTIRIGLAKADAMRKDIGTGLRADMDKNQAIKFTEPRYIGGLALVTWRAANMALSLIAYRKNYGEYLQSPWLIADVAGILAGSALMGNPNILELIKSKGGRSPERQAILAAVCDMIVNKPRITKKYFTRELKNIAGKKETGMVELLSLIRKEKKRKHEPMHVKIEEVLKVAESKDPVTKNHEVVRGVSPELIALLKDAKGDERNDLERYMNVICASGTMETTDILEQWVADMDRMYGTK